MAGAACYREAMTGPETCGGRGLIADPIHRYLLYTRPGRRRRRAGPHRHNGGPAPAADPPAPVGPLGLPRRRAQPGPHVLGAMHVAGRFGQQLAPSLRAVCPGRPRLWRLIEELLRVTGLLHDVGPRPFGSFLR